MVKLSKYSWLENIKYYINRTLDTNWVLIIFMYSRKAYWFGFSGIVIIAHVTSTSSRQTIFIGKQILINFIAL